MSGSPIKTTQTDADVAAFIAAINDPRRREDAEALDALHRRVTGCDPQMWGPSIIGYGRYHYMYESGREGDMCRAGFSPRKAASTIYLVGDFAPRQGQADALFARLGKHKTGQACLYVNRLAQVDPAVLEELVSLSWALMNERYPQ